VGTDVFAPARDALQWLPGVAGAIVTDEAGATLFEHGADDELPAASVIKVPLVMALYADAAEGRLDLGERVAAGARADGTGVLRHLADLAELTLRDLAMLTIIVSDNTATNRLIERIGTDRVNARLAEWGCARTRLRRKMYDFEAAAKGSENVMTARETASLFRRLLRGECRDRATSDAVLGILERCQDKTMLRRYLPPATRVAHKTGTLDASRNDAGIVYGDQPVVACAFVSSLRDPKAGDAWLGLLGWCAYRAAGGAGGPLPSERWSPA
jgi:beta-lactamase class A